MRICAQIIVNMNQPLLASQVSGFYHVDLGLIPTEILVAHWWHVKVHLAWSTVLQKVSHVTTAHSVLHGDNLPERSGNVTDLMAVRETPWDWSKVREGKIFSGKTVLLASCFGPYRKNLEHRLRFDKVTDSYKVGTFFEKQCNLTLNFSGRIHDTVVS